MTFAGNDVLLALPAAMQMTVSESVTTDTEPSVETALVEGETALYAADIQTESAWESADDSSLREEQAETTVDGLDDLAVDLAIVWESLVPVPAHLHRRTLI